MRQEAARLRADGVGRAAIARQLGIGFSTVARWFREDGVQAPVGVHGRELWRITNRRTIEERWAHEQAEQDAHRDAVGSLTERELFLVGVALYWAEGTKSKPWRRSHTLKFVNSDESMIRVWLAWLKSLGVTGPRLRCSLMIHESADVPEAEAYWRLVVGPDAHFTKTALKRHVVSPRRHNVGAGYRGCLCIRVLDGASLYRMVAGAWEGIAAAATTIGSPSTRSPVV